MDNRKKEYLDKIVMYLFEDTDFEYVPNDKDCTVVIDNFLTVDCFNDWKYYNHTLIQDFCTEDYGLTEDETKYVWREYNKMIYYEVGKIVVNNTNRNINESNDKRKNYLDKVTDFIVDDSNFVVGRTPLLNSPFYIFSWEYFLRNQNTPIIYFVEYIKNTYGVTQSESKYVWDKYVSKLKDMRYNQMTTSITESVKDDKNLVMGNPYDMFKFDGISDELKQKLIKIIEHTVDSIFDSITYEPLEDRNDMYIIKINDFNITYGLYLENDGSESSFRKFCLTYMDYIFKEMTEILRVYTNRNPMLISGFGLGATVLLLNKMGEIFINE